MNRRREESGFALLLVFLMAASIAIMLYSQMPRVAFESQRMKEELLIERGEQYIRAIQLYTAEWRNYPQSLDQLEKTNNKRYLRRRYKDPMTGEDEWRLLHINAAGMLTDSKIKKKDEKKPNQNTFITEMAGIGVTQSPDKTGVNVALRRRPSDGGMGNAPGTDPAAPGMPAVAPGTPQAGQGIPVGAPPVPGQMPPGQGPQSPYQSQSQAQISQDPEREPSQQAGLPGQLGQQGLPPGAVQPGYTQPVVPGSPQPGQPMQQGYPSPAGQQPYPGPQPYPGQQPYPAQPGAQPGYPGGQAQQGRPGQPVPGQPGNPALQMIQNILTSPRPEMANNNMQVPGAPGLAIGGGIAGVASKAEMKSIKVYNERERYDEWEFVYDVRKDKRLKQQAGQFGQGLGTMNGANPGMSPGMTSGAPGFSQQPAQTVPMQLGSPQPVQPGSPQPAPSGGYPSPAGIGR